MVETLHDVTRLEGWTGDADDLWLVTAVVQPFKLETLTLALEALPEFGGMTVSECRGFGRGKVSSERIASGGPARASAAQHAGSAPSSRGETDSSGVIDYTKKTKVEAAVSGRRAALNVARLIARVAHTGRQGDGKVLISRLSGVVGIRHFDLDHDAL